MEKNDHSKSSRYDVFANLLLQRLESTYCNFSTFTANHLPEIKAIQKDLMEFARVYQSGYELEDLINYSKETQFLENYCNSNDGDTKILENINWYLKKGESMLNYNDSLRPDELAIFFENIIYFSFLKPPKQQKKTSYMWKANPDKELPELYSLMIDKYKLIASESTYDQFKAVFTGQPIDDSFEPIRWHQNNASELLYFNEAIKKKVDNVWNIYQRMAACFVKPDGKPFKAVWKSLKTNIDINLSPDKQKTIDELVSDF